MVLYYKDHVTSSTGYTIQKCILPLVIITAQIVEIAGFVILERGESSQYQPWCPYISIRQISVISLYLIYLGYIRYNKGYT